MSGAVVYYRIAVRANAGWEWHSGPIPLQSCFPDQFGESLATCFSEVENRLAALVSEFGLEWALRNAHIVQAPTLDAFDLFDILSLEQLRPSIVSAEIFDSTTRYSTIADSPEIVDAASP